MSLEAYRGAMRLIITLVFLLVVTLMIGTAVGQAAALGMSLSAIAYPGTLTSSPPESGLALLVGTILLGLAATRGRRPRI